MELTLTSAPPADDGEGTDLVCSGTVTGGRAGSPARGEGRDLGGRTAAGPLRRRPRRQHRGGPPPAARGRGGHRRHSRSGDGAEGPVAGVGAPGDNERAIPGIPGRDESDEGRNRLSRPMFRPPWAPTPAGAAGPDGSRGAPGEYDSGDRGRLEAAGAEAAHARRTMIGRSAEEVDHAPPRGRYAPVPAPEPTTATAGPCAGRHPPRGSSLARAVVVGRVLRRRR